MKNDEINCDNAKCEYHHPECSNSCGILINVSVCPDFIDITIFDDDLWIM
jgi:hypothetical protein